jgi:UDP-sugar pyrophosphorylase
MMQDIPKLFQKEYNNANIGFTNFDRWFSFSPAKNSLESGQEAVLAGNTAPGTMSSAESDLYIQNHRKLQYINGVTTIPVSEYTDYVSIAGIPVTPGPRIVLEPSFGITRKEYQEKIIGPVSITQRSSIVLSGQHITIKKLSVDGALVINTGPDTYITIDGLQVNNSGWVLEELQPNIDYPEEVRIRGYTMNKIETTEYIINEPGNFIINASGEIKKVE